MRLLLDSSVWGPTAAALSAAGHDVIWVGDRPSDPGDVAILAEAHRQRRILVTLDRDFGRLAVQFGYPHAGIIRLEQVPSRGQANVCIHVLDLFGEELQDGAIVTARPDRVRVRRSDQEV